MAKVTVTIGDLTLPSVEAKNPTLAANALLEASLQPPKSMQKNHPVMLANEIAKGAGLKDKFEMFRGNEVAVTLDNSWKQFVKNSTGASLVQTVAASSGRKYAYSGGSDAPASEDVVLTLQGAKLAADILGKNVWLKPAAGEFQMGVTGIPRLPEQPIEPRKNWERQGCLLGEGWK